MGMSSKKLKNKRKEAAKQNRANKKKQEVNEEVLSSISDPNPWTPEKEDAWLRQPADALRNGFPPMTKPRHTQYRNSGTGWGEEA